MRNHIVELVEVSKSFDTEGPAAVNNLTLNVYEGEVLALLGPSGCGKTTTLRLIAGFEQPDTGIIRVGDRIVAGPGRWVPPEQRGIGIVFQEYALFPHMSVADNVAFGLHRLPRAEREQRVREVLDLVGLGEYASRYPHELSGGQQQRVALARALAPQPVVVLLDEPFSNLDADLRQYMRHEVKRILREWGSTAIFVTHDQEEALSVGDRVAVLNAGRLEQVGTPEYVFHHPATRFVADFLGLADFLPARSTQDGLETEIGFVRQPVPGELGRALEVMIRPHDVRLRFAPEGRGLIVGRQFHGDCYVYAVQLPSGRIVHSEQDHTVDMPVGTRVDVLLDAGHTLTCFEGERAILCPQECELPALRVQHQTEPLAMPPVEMHAPR
ncbi:MAG: ABC transporter ATP-binding protein [Ardenticatenia bacterium]|uniref:ABC transporter ATP-binding protein n=1 Tax=Ardenticatena maritima TaxID=872965 RepID=UPI0009EB08B2|nr:ABC transporter ATP-binding protein [Ardenticatena maritima]RME12480.1 MAG: ABC transporter ATP-binding protein [Ardenticatenia bacterium]